MLRKTGAEFKASGAAVADGAILTISGYASTRDVDSTNDIVEPTAFANSLPKYLDHPILLFGHDWYSMPIGKVTRAKIDKKGLWIDAAIADTTQGRDIKTLVDFGILKSFSIGFWPTDIKSPEKDGDPRVIEGLDLAEISVVNVPANRQALFEAAKGCEPATLALKSLFNDNPPHDGRGTQEGSHKMADRQDILPEDFKSALRQAETMTKNFGDKVEEVAGRLDQVQTATEQNARIIKMIQDQGEALRKGYITEAEFKGFTDKLGGQVLSLQHTIDSIKGAQRAVSERMPVTSWKGYARDILEYKDGRLVNAGGIDIAWDDQGRPLPDVLQRARFLLQEPVDYNQPGGGLVKIIRDLNDIVYLSHVYLSQKARGRYDIMNLKAFKLFRTLVERVDPEFAKALYSTGTGVGDEWVPTEMSATLYEQMALEAKVEGYIPHWQMPSNPATWPIKTTTSTAYIYPEAAVNNPTQLTKSQFATTNVTFTTRNAGVAIPVSPEFMEDSIIDVIPAIRNDMALALAKGKESAIINGDDAASHRDTQAGWVSGNMEYGEDGLRRMAIDSQAGTGAKNTFSVQATSGIGDKAATFGEGDVRGLRDALPSPHGVNADNLVYVTTPRVWFKMLSFAPVAQAGTYNMGKSTWSDGSLNMFDGSPVVLTGQMVDTYHTDGLWSTTGATSSILCFDKTAFKVGEKRGVTVEYDNDILTQQRAFVATTRYCFRSMRPATDHAVSMGYNIPA